MNAKFAKFIKGNAINLKAFCAHHKANALNSNASANSNAWNVGGFVPQNANSALNLNSVFVPFGSYGGGDYLYSLNHICHNHTLNFKFLCYFNTRKYRLPRSFHSLAMTSKSAIKQIAHAVRCHTERSEVSQNLDFASGAMTIHRNFKATTQIFIAMILQKFANLKTSFIQNLIHIYILSQIFIITIQAVFQFLKKINTKDR